MQREEGKLFVGGLSWNTDQDMLREYFSKFGEVSDAVVMRNTETGKSRGFGFISFRDPSVAEICIQAKHMIDNRQVDAKPCNTKSGSRGGAGGGGESGGRGRGGPRQQRPEYNAPTNKIFIGGIPASATEDSIKSTFSQYGDVTEVVIMMDKEAGRSRGFGFLTFETEESVDQVCQLHYVILDGKKVECKRAEPRGRNGPGMGRGGGGGGGPGQGFQPPGQNWGGMGGFQQGFQQPGYGGPPVNGFSQQAQGGYGEQGYGYGQQAGGYPQQQQWNQGGQGAWGSYPAQPGATAGVPQPNGVQQTPGHPSGHPPITVVQTGHPPSGPPTQPTPAGQVPPAPVSQTHPVQSHPPQLQLQPVPVPVAPPQGVTVSVAGRPPGLPTDTMTQNVPPQTVYGSAPPPHLVTVSAAQPHLVTVSAPPHHAQFTMSAVGLPSQPGQPSQPGLSIQPQQVIFTTHPPRPQQMMSPPPQHHIVVSQPPMTIYGAPPPQAVYAQSLPAGYPVGVTVAAPPQTAAPLNPSTRPPVALPGLPALEHSQGAQGYGAAAYGGQQATPVADPYAAQQAPSAQGMGQYQQDASAYGPNRSYGQNSAQAGYGQSGQYTAPGGQAGYGDQAGYGAGAAAVTPGAYSGPDAQQQPGYGGSAGYGAPRGSQGGAQPYHPYRR